MLYCPATFSSSLRLEYLSQRSFLFWWFIAFCLFMAEILGRVLPLDCQLEHFHHKKKKKIIKYQNACGSVLWCRAKPVLKAGFMLLVYLHDKPKSLILGKPVLERSKMKLSILMLDYMTKVIIFQGDRQAYFQSKRLEGEERIQEVFERWQKNVLEERRRETVPGIMAQFLIKREGW